MKFIRRKIEEKVSVAIVGLLSLFYVLLRNNGLVSGLPVLSLENIKTVAMALGLLILTIAMLTVVSGRL